MFALQLVCGLLAACGVIGLLYLEFLFRAVWDGDPDVCV